MHRLSVYDETGKQRLHVADCGLGDAAAADAAKPSGASMLLAGVRRGSGASWLKRQVVSGVSLAHPLLDASVSGGGERAGSGCLRASEAMVLSGPPKSGKSEYLYFLCAHQAIDDGRGEVVVVTAPGGAHFNSRRMLACLERVAQEKLEVISAGGAAGSSASAMDLETMVMIAAQRISSYSTNDVEEFKQLLTSTDGSSEPLFAGEPSCGGEATAGLQLPSNFPTEPRTRLLIVDGLGGVQYMAMYERMRGEELPWRDWISVCAARYGCAVVVSDSSYHSSVPPPPPGGVAHNNGDTCEVAPFNMEAEISTIHASSVFRQMIKSSNNINNNVTHSRSGVQFQTQNFFSHPRRSSRMTPSSCLGSSPSSQASSHPPPSLTLRGVILVDRTPPPTSVVHSRNMASCASAVPASVRLTLYKWCSPLEFTRSSGSNSSSSNGCGSNGDLHISAAAAVRQNQSFQLVAAASVGFFLDQCGLRM